MAVCGAGGLICHPYTGVKCLIGLEPMIMSTSDIPKRGAASRINRTRLYYTDRLVYIEYLGN